MKIWVEDNPPKVQEKKEGDPAKDYFDEKIPQIHIKSSHRFKALVEIDESGKVRKVDVDGKGKGLLEDAVKISGQTMEKD